MPGELHPEAGILTLNFHNGSVIMICPRKAGGRDKE
jgi:hypothetical protein